ncbi:hypothetical protein IR215_25815 [Simulacricoccus sp. 17bor-14]|nr:hypothetical protein [Simulacricoccus sp. 17bor-14]
MQEQGAGRFGVHAGAAAGVVVGAALAAWLLAQPGGTRESALVGVGLAGASSAVALLLKRRAVQGDLKAALKVMGMVFGLRAVLVAVGLAVAVKQGGSAVAFVLGFFGAYFALQCIELSYVVAAARRGPDGDAR